MKYYLVFGMGLAFFPIIAVILGLLGRAEVSFDGYKIQPIFEQPK